MRLSLTVAYITAVAAFGCGPYARGPLVLPPPPALRPGHGLPTYDPAHPQVKPESGPRPTRVLPQTPETRRGPGLWAAEPTLPGASIYDKPWPTYPKEPGVTHSLDLVFEAPPELAALLPKETADVRFRCQWNMTQARLRVPRFVELTTLPSRVQKCAHAKLVLHCYGSNLDEYLAIIRKAPQHADALLERVLGDLLAKAREDHRRVCMGTKLGDGAAGIVDDVINAFDRMMEEGDGIGLGELPRPMSPGGPRH